MTDPINPDILLKLQTTFINVINHHFDFITHFAASILYVLAAIEIGLLGLSWVLDSSNILRQGIQKILFISILFFFVFHFTAIIQCIIDGFTYLGFKLAEPAHVYLFDPGKLWSIGLLPGLKLLAIAIKYGASNMGAAIIYLSLGFAIIAMFTLMAAQVILTICQFYLTALISLIITPFGVFYPARQLFTQSIKYILSAALKVIALILILGITIPLLAEIPVDNITETSPLYEPITYLALCTIVLLMLWKLPNIICNMVGNFETSLFSKSDSSTIFSVNTSTPLSAAQNSPIATNSSAMGSGPNPNQGISNISALQAASTMPTTSSQPTNPVAIHNSSPASSSNPHQEKSKAASLKHSSEIDRGEISALTIKKVEKTFRKVLNETTQQNQKD
jgi:P-type conjugative transfer protein TrbL